MMEYPEAVTVAKQVNEILAGATIARAERENSPHKWVFYSRPREDYETLLPGRRIKSASPAGSLVEFALSGGYVLQLGDGGVRILLHEAGAKLPAKYHLLLEFKDGRSLSLGVAGWGAARLLDAGQHRQYTARDGGPSPVDESLTARAFDEALAGYTKPVKQFFVNRALVKGVGNGYLQDILFRAGIHPARKGNALTAAQRRQLFKAMRAVIAEGIAKGGRDDELDLLGRPGRYVRMLDKRTVGKPCRACGQKIEKMSFLGGTCCFCPRCQAK
jgi:formamidopyrimidine-DNA glycosylase